MDVLRPVRRVLQLLQAGQSRQRRASKKTLELKTCPSCKVTLNQDGHCYNRACPTFIAPISQLTPSRSRQGKGRILEISAIDPDRSIALLSDADRALLDQAFVEEWIEPPAHLSGRSPNAKSLRRSKRLRFRASQEVERALSKMWAQL